MTEAKNTNATRIVKESSGSFDETMEGPNPTQHVKGTKKKVDKVVNKYFAQRRENGLSSGRSKPKPSTVTEAKNTNATRIVKESGGSFGEPLIDDYIDELDIPEDPWFGAPGTREIRSAQRSKKIESTIDSIKNIFSSEGSENILDDFTKDSIDPSVVQVIYRQPLDEVSKTIENATVS